MYSFAVNKYLYPVASVGFLFSLNNDARNHELEKKKDVPQGLIGKKNPAFKYPRPAGTADNTTIFKTPGFHVDTVAT